MIRIIPLALALAASGPALADPWKDESRRGGWRGDAYAFEAPRDRKVKFRTADGCEVERKWKKGEYEEKVKCKRGRGF